MFDLEQFISDCRAAVAADPSHKAARQVVARTVSDPSTVIRRLGEPRRAVVDALYRGDDVTVLNVVWGPHMTFRPHDHRLWAVIGIYSGQEDNIFWRRVPGGSDVIEPVGARSLSDRDAEPLGRDVIHSVTNPLSRLTGAIHIYGGDFYSVERSEWDPETLEERRYDLEANLRMFEEANARSGRFDG